MKKTKEIIEYCKENKWLHYIVIIAIGIILSVPLKYIQIRDTHDGCLHYLRIMGTINSFKLGQIPPIVAPFYCNGWGYAMNLFYNPIVTYIPLLLKLCIPSYMLMLKIYAGICIVLSGITMYIFVNSVTDNKAIALISAILYMAAPYKLGDIYRRYAIGEFTSFIFILILFQGLYSLLKKDGSKHYLISISTILLLLTHTVTTFYLAIFSGVYVLFNIKKLKEKFVLNKIFINLFLVIMVCMFFVMPMMEARIKGNYTIFDDEIMHMNGDYVYNNTLTIDRLFKENVVIFEDTIFCIGIIIAILFALNIILYRFVDNRYKDLYIIFIMFSILSLYMCTKYCPWFILPNFFCKLQYPWRMLGFFNFFSSFIIGINLYIILKFLFKKDLIRILVASIILGMIVSNSISIMMQFKTNDENRDEKYINSIMNDLEINPLRINREYMTFNALVKQRNYLQEREHDTICILQGEADIINQNKEELSMSAKIKDISKDTILEFPFLYYPGYEVIIKNENGIEKKYEAIESENGFASIQIENNIDGESQINIEFKPTKLTKISYIISGVSLIILIVYIIYEKGKNKEKIEDRIEHKEEIEDKIDNIKKR